MVWPTDRVNSFPLSPACNERGINARIADKLVWDKIASLMSSPELLQTQLDRWTHARQNKVMASIDDTKAVERETTKLKDQEERYNKAYGAGLITIEQLRQYTAPLKEQIVSLETQIAKVRQQENQVNATVMPSGDEIKSFAEESAHALSNLSFELKRAIVTSVVEKIIATQQKLEVNGYVPITTSPYVKFKTTDRYRGSSQCWKVNLIPTAYQKTSRHLKLSLCHH